MSVILRDSGGNIRLISKGAESSILPKCKTRQPTTLGGASAGHGTEVMQNATPHQITQHLPDLQDVTLHHINDFAARGLRTLACAVKKMDQSEYDAFKEKFDKASQALDKREQRIKQVYILLFFKFC